MATVSDASSELPPWSDLPPELIGIIHEKMCCSFDRTALRSVCHSWRAAARQHPAACRPLPLLVCPGFVLASPFTDRTMQTAAHRLNMTGTPIEKDPYSHGQCIGSWDDWLVIAKIHCLDWTSFLLNPFSSHMIPLPDATKEHSYSTVQMSVPLSGGDGIGEISCTIHGCPTVLFLKKAVLSCSPVSGSSSCILAAVIQRQGHNALAFCQPGTDFWCICSGTCIKGRIDIEFHEGKLYVIDCMQGKLFVFELDEYKSTVPVVTRASSCYVEMDKEHLSGDSYKHLYNLVQSRGELLLVVRYFKWHLLNFVKAKVFRLDFSSTPWKWRLLKSLDFDNILISSYSSKPFTACGADCDEMTEGNVFLLDNFCQNFVPKDGDKYSYGSQVCIMKDGTIRPFLIGNGPTKGGLGLPLWFCPW